MKKLIYIICTSLVLQIGCTDLDVTPKIGGIPSDIFTNAGAYESYLAKIYAAFNLTGQEGPAGNADISVVSDEGFTSYLRVYWKAQTFTTEEAFTRWEDAGIRDLHAQSWGSENQFVKVLYYRIFFIISYANDFLDKSSTTNLESYGITDAASIKSIEGYRAEARFLRALAYWHALDLFGNIPVVKSLTLDLPVQSKPADTFAFIESELAELESLLPEPENTAYYGRASKGALWMLQAKIFLNAEVYLQNGNGRYDDVVTAVNKVIGANYQLDDNYAELFMADNHTSPEIIYAITQDGQFSQTWGGTTTIISGGIGGEIMDPADQGVNGAWGGHTACKELVLKFGPDPANPIDPRGMFFTEGQSLEVDAIESGDFEQGIAVVKWTNKKSDGTDGSSEAYPDTDFPIFRLADAYMMYAEAVLRGASNGDRTTALSYLNMLRERAYGDVSANINDGEMTLDFILDERAREFYWEATRRVDLIRFGKFSDQGIWTWKGGVKEGRTTESFRNIFPIPADDLISNPKLVQNPGY